MQYQKIEYTLIREDRAGYNKKAISGAEDVFKFFTDLQDADREKFFTVCLDAKNYITCFDLVTMGSISSALVFVREVIKSAILTGAKGIVTAHNHPSGDPKPSPEDAKITKAIAKACRLFGINFLDHVVVGDGRYFSYADSGIMPSKGPI